MTPRLTTLFTLVIGVTLFSYSLTLSYYSDQQAADDLTSHAYNLEKQDYYKKEAALRTDKIPFMDLGSGLAIASVTLLVYFIFTKVRTFRDLRNNRTLTKTATFVSANLVWLLLLPGTYWYYLFCGGRGDYPPFADSIGIPIMNQILVYLFLLIPLNLFLFLTTLKTALPSRLFVRPSTYSRRTILWEIFFGFWLLINLVGLVAVDYLNQNPVETGLVFRAEHYRYSRLDDADKNRIFIFQTAKRIAIWQGIYSK